jgi:hypothetical protein
MSIECIGFRSHESGSLRGFANFRIPKMGIEIFGCGVFMNHGNRFLSLPSREYTDKESGEKKYMSILRFIDKNHHEGFCKAALHAMDEWCAKNAQQQEEVCDETQQEESPF